MQFTTLLAITFCSLSGTNARAIDSSLFTRDDDVYYITKQNTQTAYPTVDFQFSCEDDDPVWYIYKGQVPGESGECHDLSGQVAGSGVAGVIGKCMEGDYSDGWKFCPEGDGGNLNKDGESFFRSCSPKSGDFQVTACQTSLVGGCMMTEQVVMVCDNTEHPVS